MKRGRRIGVCLMVLLFGLSLAGLHVSPLLERASAVTQSDIDEMKNSIDEIAGQIDELEDQLADIEDDKEQALQQKAYLDQQIALINQQIADTQTVIDEYSTLIAEKQTEISDLQAKEEAQYTLFCQRVRSMEEQGSVSYLAILFNSASFAELLDNAMLVGEIMDYDQAIIDQLEATRAELEDAKAVLESEQAEQQALQDTQEASRAELQVQEAKATALVHQIAAQQSEYESAIEELEAEDARIQSEMEAAQRSLAAQNAGVVSEAGFYWPVPGYYTLTSGFGYRVHPVYGTTRHHNGTDIAAPKNTPIGAAKSGVVTTSQYSSSYGNYVIVNHSDGYSTLYAHMTSRAVSVGDVVTQGQTIGYVGSTGVSTGNHLHYEVWYNGSRTDAEQYYPNLDSVFIRRYNM